MKAEIAAIEDHAERRNIAAKVASELVNCLDDGEVIDEELGV
jgi:hypothetical protein